MRAFTGKGSEALYKHFKLTAETIKQILPFPSYLQSSDSKRTRP